MIGLGRLLGLLRPYAGWMALGILLSFITLMANLTLMAVSGWFIASMAIAAALADMLRPELAAVLAGAGAESA